MQLSECKVPECTFHDLSLLAELSRQLYEDEGNDRIPSNNSFKKLLKEGSKAYFFIENEEIVGYALVKTEQSYMELKHFFICREMRGKHLGTVAFNLLINELNCDTIDLEVFCWNQIGQKFWKSLGFEERGIIMRKKR